MKTIKSLVQGYQEAELELREAINNEIYTAASVPETQRSHIIAALNSSCSIEALKCIIDTLANRGEYMGETCIKLDHGMRMVARKLKKDLAYL